MRSSLFDKANSLFGMFKNTKSNRNHYYIFRFAFVLFREIPFAFFFFTNNQNFSVVDSELYYRTKSRYLKNRKFTKIDGFRSQNR